ncbi:MAG: signal recognition particle protein [Chloroflexi bacterium]|nr:MAG: signal recognition particle protein [Chloroflexota bacterium]TMG02790.1 MAG: signal recognition particle protein [Chloroflexota bacterium]
MFDSLTDKLQGVFRRLGGRGTITEKDLDEALREVRLALLEADVNYKVVKDFVAGVRERALGADVTKSLTPMQQIIDIVNQQMIEMLGGGHAALQKAKSPPTVVMLVGLKGSGKTTTAAKLGLHLRRGGDSPLMVAADPERVAGAEQLTSLGKQLQIPVVTLEDGAKPERACKQGLAEAKRTNASSVLVDTVGYVHVDSEAQASLKSLHKALSPHEVLLVADAMTGQEAVHAAEEFNRAVPLTGLILTKLDGDARGGAALSIRAVTGVPIKFVGVGEKADALEPFYPDRFASRILGMGDLLTLIEKAKAELTDEDAESLTERLKKGEVTLDDFLEQFQRIKRMGPLGQLVGMIPGLSQIKNRLNVDEMDESFFNRVEAMIYSMTKEERRAPEIIDGSRRRRIAMGSGTQPADVNRLLKQYKEAKKILQMISTGRGSKITPFLR